MNNPQPPLHRDKFEMQEPPEAYNPPLQISEEAINCAVSLMHLPSNWSVQNKSVQDSVARTIQLAINASNSKLVEENKKLSESIVFYKTSMERIANKFGIDHPLQLIVRAENNQETYVDILLKVVDEQKEQLTSEISKLKELLKRDGNWLDKWGVCKVCGGEIPHGHTDECHIFKQESEISRLKSELAEAHRMADFNEGAYKELQQKLSSAEKMVCEMREALNRIFWDFKTSGKSTGNYSDGEYTQDYTTRKELIEKALSLSAPIAGKWRKEEA